ncbi:aminotransferase class I/II-fold pyridoxal phosphate-dependent enzyme [Desulfuribacillus alkaliarsenatis]|uniref:Aminotransferase n=1 Tax=Desulfuribacillus alkaliarsenatis TaxID=766136 RepID=A0A1E5G5P6_9FIRM|nr:aminotransferase class I/II-fold pyridoxal phosphate-dependent enzyme [Desulfuribacillus alkaliarsenatis]OEF98510.1 aromatic amino acid aminotransferase [Desulfuribacillus alkaliarsenatis]
MNIQEKLSPQVKQIPPSGIRKFFDLVVATKGVISLGVGEPDFVTPWHVRESSIHSLEQGMTSYTSNSGLLELREEICRYMDETFALKYSPNNEIMVTVGASEAIDIALRTIASQGDEVLIVEPCYVSYGPCATLAGATPVSVPTYQKDDFKLMPEVLESKITPKSKAIIMCFPNNPTGGVMEEEDLKKIADIIKKHDLLVISDEVYAELTYGKKHASIANIEGMKDRTILISGLSKSFAMTGWRIGFAMAHPEIIAAMLKIHQYTILCAPIMGQIAALEALRNGKCEMDKMIEQYDQRRKLIVKGFQEIGLSCHIPKGAFYAFPNIEATGYEDHQFAEELLKETKVAVVPGSVFGQGGKGFIRCSYATSYSQITEALERIGEFVLPLIDKNKNEQAI